MIRIHLPEPEARHLEQLFRATEDRRLRDRLQIVLMAHRQRPRQDIAALKKKRRWGKSSC